MKKLFKVSGSAVGAAALLVIWSGSAGAATATCPGVSAPVDTSGNFQVTVNTTNGSVQCWDYGNSNSNPDYEYDTDVRTFPTSTPADNTNLQLPELGTEIFEQKVDKISGTTGYLTVGVADCSGTGCIANFSLSHYIDKPIYLVFKFGGTDPAWVAFRFAAGFISTLADTVTWQSGSYTSAGIWTPASDTSSDKLSHTSLLGSPPGDEWRPIPIPAAAWLLGSGLLGLFAVGRRRKAGTVAAA